MNLHFQTNFGNVVRARRKKLGLRQEDLAAYSGLARTTIVHIEKGHYGLSLTTIKALSIALRMPMYKLVKEAEGL